MRLCLFLLLVSCSTMAQTLEGSWRASGELAPGKPDGPGFAWFKTYTFDPDADTYTMSGYSPITESGKFEILNAGKPEQTLRFFDRIFMNEPGHQVSRPLQWSDDGRSFELGGERYYRQTSD